MGTQYEEDEMSFDIKLDRKGDLTPASKQAIRNFVRRRFGSTHGQYMQVVKELENHYRRELQMWEEFGGR